MTEGVTDEQAIAVLVAILRRTKPAKVFGVELDGGARIPIAISTGKAARYRHTAAMIFSRLNEWERVDLCNGRGELIESWKPPTSGATEDAAADLATQFAGDGAGAPRMTADERVLAFASAVMSIVQRAVDHAVDRQNASMRVANEGLALLLKSQAERLAVVEKQQTGMLKLAYDAVRVSAYHEGRAELGRELHALQSRARGQDGEPVDAMAEELMRRALGLGAGTNGPTNGAADHKKPDVSDL